MPSVRHSGLNMCRRHRLPGIVPPMATSCTVKATRRGKRTIHRRRQRAMSALKLLVEPPSTDRLGMESTQGRRPGIRLNKSVVARVIVDRTFTTDSSPWSTSTTGRSWARRNPRPDRGNRQRQSTSSEHALGAALGQGWLFGRPDLRPRHRDRVRCLANEEDPDLAASRPSSSEASSLRIVPACPAYVTNSCWINRVRCRQDPVRGAGKDARRLRRPLLACRQLFH